MAIHIPKAREVLKCEFDQRTSYSPPEICKSRPVVVVSCSPARPHLAIVIPLSTTPPNPHENWHHKLSRASMWDRQHRWAKCDLIQPVSYDRLEAWKLGGRTPDGKRRYLRNFFISDDDFKAIHACIFEALNIKPHK
jgi:uncharacterized protein YifN (PemK superfamily)